MKKSIIFFGADLLWSIFSNLKAVFTANSQLELKKTVLFLTAVTCFTTAFGQIYQNNENKGIAYTFGDSYTIDDSNDDLVITSNGSPGAYDAFGIGIGEVLDLSNNATVFIRARATGSPTLRIDLSDTDGFSTNASSQSINLTNSFEVYQIDYAGNFVDQYSEACAALPSTTCPVNDSAIQSLLGFINPGTGGYNGTIEIDWISFGAPLGEQNQPTQSNGEFQLRYNQLGYTVNEDKLLSIVSLDGAFSDKTYTVYDSSNTPVQSGSTGSSQYWEDADEHVFSVDISSLNQSGTYRFEIDETEVNFKIENDPYEDIREEVFKYYYYNRASTGLTAQYAGQFERPTALPDTNVEVHTSAASSSRPAGTIISAPKGWYDAGDYNKYIVNSGISTYTLLAAYENYSNYFSETSFTIPENGGQYPDILDETKWNIDWMLAMQDPADGGVYHKLTGLGFSGTVTPDNYSYGSGQTQRYVVQKSTGATLDFAAVMAMASRIYKPFDEAYSDQLLQAARDAYSWAQSNPTMFYVQSTINDVQTGEYGDSNYADEFQWAAVELLITTGENEFANNLDLNSVYGGIPNWQNVATLAVYSIASNPDNVPQNIVDDANNILLSMATSISNTVESSAMNISMESSDYVWGSNGVAANQIMLLLNAYKLTNDQSLLDAAYKAIDYLFGRNGTNYSAVTGFGDLFPVDPHHRLSAADNVSDAYPGMLVGGPHSPDSAFEFECDPNQYPSNQPAKSYLDEYCSYSRNEVTINWNAPLVYSLHALRAIQTNNTGEVDLPQQEQEPEVSGPFTPDPNKTYYIDSPIHGLRVAATGEAENPYTTSITTTGSDVEWKFVDKGNGSWHIQKADGGTKPRLRSRNNGEADMQPTRFSGTWTYYDFAPGALDNTYFATLPDHNPKYQRIQVTPSGEINYVPVTNDGTWESLRFTVVEEADSEEMLNIALSETASQSSTALNGIASRTIDDNTLSDSKESPLGASFNSNKNELVVSPNPFSVELHIQTPVFDLNETATLEILNQVGEIIFTKQNVVSGEIIHFTDNLDDGAYFIKWTNKDGTVVKTEQVIKQ